MFNKEEAVSNSDSVSFPKVSKNRISFEKRQIPRLITRKKTKTKLNKFEAQAKDFSLSSLLTLIKIGIKTVEREPKKIVE